MLYSREDAYSLLNNLGASKQLVTHAKLVGEAADLLIQKCEELKLALDYEFIRMGVVIHDVGKIVHLHEMNMPGSEHEPEGQKILLDKGVSTRLARVCMSHARWVEMECSLEELLIALSDKLWKGKRVGSLELEVVDRISDLLDVERWDIFTDMDMKFEEIAAGGYERLQRSSRSQYTR